MSRFQDFSYDGILYRRLAPKTHRFVTHARPIQLTIQALFDPEGGQSDILSQMEPVCPQEYKKYYTKPTAR